MRTLVSLLVLASVLGCRDAKTPKVDEASWRQIEAWGAPTVAPGATRNLDAARAAIEPLGDEVDDAWHDTENKRAGALLAPRLEPAVASLIAWHEDGGGIRRLDCGDSEWMKDSPLWYMQVARAALLAADDDPASPEVAATLYLSHRLRAEGHTLLEAAIGTALAEAALDWAEARGLGPSGPFRDYPLDDVFITRAFASEAVCQQALIDAALGRGDADDVGGVSTALLNAQREQLRAFQLATVEGIHARASDDDALEAFVTQRQEAANADDQAELVRILGLAPSMAINQLIDHRARHRAFLQTEADR